MSISDALTTVSTIEQQLAQLQNGTLLDSALGASAGSAFTPGAGASAAAAQFAAALAQAGASGSSAATPATIDGGAGLGGVSSGQSAALLSALLGGGGGSVASSAATGSVTLPAAAQSLLTSSQQQFASTLSAETGLSPSVVSAWLRAEESGSAARSRQAQNNNDWLNIGYTDAATYGSSDSVWGDPVTAATATAAWMRGQDSIPGYGTASAGVQSILASVGQTPQAQIQAIQGSGWASSGYPGLSDVYAQVAG